MPTHLGFPGGSNDKESACNAGDLGLIPGLGRSSGEGKRSLVSYSPWGREGSDRTERLTLSGTKRQYKIHL